MLEESLTLNTGKANVLVIKNERCFDRIVSSLYLDVVKNRKEPPYLHIFNSKFESIDKTDIVFVMHPLTFDFSENAVKKGLLKKLKGEWILAEERDALEREYAGFISNFFRYIRSVYDLDVMIEEDFSLEALFKLLKVEISTEGVCSTFETAEMILDLWLEVGSPKLIIFCGLDNYLNNECYENLLEKMELNQQSALLLENNWQKNISGCGWVLDEDFEVFEL
jgi:CRISPR type II-A-associated protein Csn2